MAAEVAAGERAVSAAIREAGTGLKAACRLQITRGSAGPHHPVGAVPQGHAQPERGRRGLVQRPDHRGRARHRPVDPLEERLVAGDPHTRRGQVAPRRPDHPRRVGTPHRLAPALHLSPQEADLPRPTRSRARCDGRRCARQADGYREAAGMLADAAGRPLAMAGLADFDLRPFNLYALTGAAGGVVSSALASIALWRGWRCSPKCCAPCPVAGSGNAAAQHRRG